MKTLLTFALLALMSSGALAHSVGQAAGLRFVFGSDPEPAITDELLSMMWMVSHAESGEAFGEISDLSVSFEMGGKTWGPFVPEAAYGQTGVYSTAHLFAQAGEYMATLTFKLDGSDVEQSISLAAHIIDRSTIVID